MTLDYGGIVSSELEDKFFLVVHISFHTMLYYCTKNQNVLMLERTHYGKEEREPARLELNEKAIQMGELLGCNSYPTYDCKNCAEKNLNHYPLVKVEEGLCWECTSEKLDRNLLKEDFSPLVFENNIFKQELEAWEFRKGWD